VAGGVSVPMLTGMRVLITGFDPFGTHSVNPSGEIAERIDGLPLPCAQVMGRVLKTSFEAVRVDLPRLVEQTSPGLIVMFGLNTHIKSLRLESGAHNWVEAIIPDNLGHRPPVGRIDASAPAWVPSTLHVGELVGRLQERGIVCEMSDDPGHFVCNFAYFVAMQTGVPSIFIHLPGQGGYPLLLEDAVQIVNICAAIACDDNF